VQFSAIFRILEAPDLDRDLGIRSRTYQHAQCPPYFYSRCSIPNDLESVSCVLPLTMKNYCHQVWSSYDHQLPVIATLLLIRYVTFQPWPLTVDLWPCSVVVHGGSHCQLLHQVWRSYDHTVLEAWVLISPIGYHWLCVCSHWACAVSRDLCVGGIFFIHTGYLTSRTPICLYNFLWRYDDA